MTWQVGTSLAPLRRSNFSEGSAGSPSPGMYGLSHGQLGRKSPMGQPCQEGGVAQSGPARWQAKASLKSFTLTLVYRPIQLQPLHQAVPTAQLLPVILRGTG